MSASVSETMAMYDGARGRAFGQARNGLSRSFRPIDWILLPGSVHGCDAALMLLAVVVSVHSFGGDGGFRQGGGAIVR